MPNGQPTGRPIRSKDRRATMPKAAKSSKKLQKVAKSSKGTNPTTRKSLKLQSQKCPKASQKRLKCVSSQTPSTFLTAALAATSTAVLPL